MRVDEREIGVAQLERGMYVARLDRPWEGTPFPLQGFLVEERDQLAWLREHCHRLWIDIRLGVAPQARDTRRSVPDSQLIGATKYVDTAGFEEEYPQAQAALAETTRAATQLLDGIGAGKPFTTEDVREAVEPVVQSILRNADTLFWVNALRRSDGYGYSHAINCSMLASAFGRHLGLPRELLVDLAGGGLLLDVGKTRLAPELLSHDGPLDPEQLAAIRSHVVLGTEILEASDGHPHETVEMVRTHHERWDGRGYPAGLQGMQIPLYGRIAAIIDSYDAITSKRPHATARSRHAALQEVYAGRGTAYQEELVQQFIACLGVFPTGALVELSNGQVGVVMVQNPSRRLRPRVMLLTDRDKQLLPQFESRDLIDQPEDVPVSEQLNVVRALPAGSYGLDPAELFL